MRINVFEGARRIAMLMGALWAAGCIAFAVFGEPSYRASYVILWPGSPPRPITGECDQDDAVRYLSSKTPDGDSLKVKLCFAAHNAEDGRRLVPYEVVSGNRANMNERYSPAVSKYADAVERAFQVPSEGLSAAMELRRRAYVDQLTNAGLLLVGGLATWWAIVAATGWIVRGFLGIPKRRDSRPDASTLPERIEQRQELEP